MGLNRFRLPVTADARQHTGVPSRRLKSVVKNKVKKKPGLKFEQLVRHL